MKTILLFCFVAFVNLNFLPALHAKTKVVDVDFSEAKIKCEAADIEIAVNADGKFEQEGKIVSSQKLAEDIKKASSAHSRAAVICIVTKDVSPSIAITVAGLAADPDAQVLYQEDGKWMSAKLLGVTEKD